MTAILLRISKRATRQRCIVQPFCHRSIQHHLCVTPERCAIARLWSRSSGMTRLVKRSPIQRRVLCRITTHSAICRKATMNQPLGQRLSGFIPHPARRRQAPSNDMNNSSPSYTHARAQDINAATNGSQPNRPVLQPALAVVAAAAAAAAATTSDRADSGERSAALHAEARCDPQLLCAVLWRQRRAIRSQTVWRPVEQKPRIGSCRRVCFSQHYYRTKWRHLADIS